jgi:hypothetical protein
MSSALSGSWDARKRNGCAAVAKKSVKKSGEKPRETSADLLTASLGDTEVPSTGGIAVDKVVLVFLPSFALSPGCPDDAT